MAFPSPYRLVPLTAEDRSRVLELDGWAFPTSLSMNDLLAAPTPITWDRTFGVARPSDNELVGMYGTYPLRAFMVPGAEVSCGFLTWVGVHPGHRRRGILRGMIEDHFAKNIAAGESISALFAAEPGIYGRFGYGLAATQLSLTIERQAPLRAVPGSDALEVDIELWNAETHGDLVARIHHAYGRLPEGLGRPGWATWETPELREVRDSDHPSFRGGKEAKRIVVVRDGENAVGYALLRRDGSWGRTGATGTVHVRDAVALTPAAAHRLWSVVLDLDLMTTVEIKDIPVDDPITSLLVDIRRAQADYADNMWVRILDLPTALAERRYAAPVDVVFEITDSMVPSNAGRWRVRAEAWGHAIVERTDEAVGLRMDVRELGAAHLGSVTFAALAQAGVIETLSPRALASASAAWAWPIAAGSDWIF